ncbi:MAG: hypothetical protein ACE5OS_14100 [Anaerolineae bacterium]
MRECALATDTGYGIILIAMNTYLGYPRNHTQQAEAQECTTAEVTRACIAKQVLSKLTALYQKNAASPVEFSTALWSVLRYEPESSPGEEVRGNT